jgi:hypothetical protein
VPAGLVVVGVEVAGTVEPGEDAGDPDVEHAPSVSATATSNASKSFRTSQDPPPEPGPS